MQTRLLAALLIGLALALVVLIVRHGAGTVGGLESSEFAALTATTAILVFVGSSLVVRYRDRVREALKAAAAWVFIALALLTGYAYRHELSLVANRVLAELVPGRAASSGRVVEIARGRSGDFQVDVAVNGAAVSMILDTGATSVVLTQEAAKAAGLPLEILAYSVSVDTANGRTQAAPVTLDRVSIGTIVETAVPALVARPGTLRRNLLGMSFLNRLESWEVRGDRLILRGRP